MEITLFLLWRVAICLRFLRGRIKEFYKIDSLYAFNINTVAKASSSDSLNDDIEFFNDHIMTKTRKADSSGWFLSCIFCKG